MFAKQCTAVGGNYSQRKQCIYEAFKICSFVRSNEQKKIRKESQANALLVLVLLWDSKYVCIHM